MDADLKAKEKIEKGIEKYEEKTTKQKSSFLINIKEKIKYPVIKLTKEDFGRYSKPFQLKLRLLYKIQTALESLWTILEKINYQTLIQFVSSFFNYKVHEIKESENYPKNICEYNPCVISFQYDGDKQGDHVIYVVKSDLMKEKVNVVYGRDQQNNNNLLIFRHLFLKLNTFRELQYIDGEQFWSSNRKKIKTINVFMLNKLN